jgi:hypothetical protein
MKQKHFFILLICIGLLLMSVDFVINDYQRFFINEPLDTEKNNENTSTPQTIPSHIPEGVLDILTKNITALEPTPAITLFSRLDISYLHEAESLQTSLIQNNQTFGIIYEFAGDESLYFQLKTALQLIMLENDSIFDANNLGDYSFYYNDNKRPNDVFLLSLINGHVWGFEYPREHHDIFKKLTKTLVNQT